MARAADVAGAVGLAALGAGVVLFVTARSPAEPAAARAAWAPPVDVADGDRSVTVLGRF
jgi:hypothetical protein